MESERIRVVLFSGGSASNLLALELERSGVNNAQVLPVFDNGGSTGGLRHIKEDVPAMGDIRNRLVTLAANRTASERAVRHLFELRFSERKPQNQLRYELENLAASSHGLTNQISGVRRSSILSALTEAVQNLPREFSLQGLAMGNLLLLGRTMQKGNFLQAVEWARELLGVHARILPVTLEAVHLGAQLEDNQWILGQANLTAEGHRLPSRIRRLYLLEREDSYAFLRKARVCSEVTKALDEADAFVLGFGSFFTSILPHFLVEGVGAKFATRQIPKILLCNPTTDKESAGLTVQDLIGIVRAYAIMNPASTDTKQSVITHVFHFGCDEKKRIPPGDLSDFLTNGGQYFDERRARSFEEIAVCACERILSMVEGEGDVQRPKVRTRRRQSPLVVVLFDLDATLFDYSELRVQATRAALKGMTADPKGMSERLGVLLRPPFTDLLFSLGLPNLRQEWNSPDVFALAQVLGDPSMQEHLGVAAEAAKEIVSLGGPVSFANRIGAYRFALKVRETRNIQVLLEAIHEAKVKSDGSSFALQREAFVQYVEENANLYPPAREIISSLTNIGSEIHVVTEGYSDIQTFKFKSLGLSELAQSCVVTDATCAVGPMLEELFTLVRDQPHIPPCIPTLYDQLSPYPIKSAHFYTKLLHALVDRQFPSLQERISSQRFLTQEEWEQAHVPSVVMVGDQYKKDIEPLLQACRSGVSTFRVLTGRYAHEDPLDQLMREGRLLPNAVFPGLAYLGAPLVAFVKGLNDPMARPTPVLPDSAVVEEVSALPIGFSKDSKRVLSNLSDEALRHRRST